MMPAPQKAHPAQLGKLALVRVEHIQTRFKIGKRDFYNAPLRLALHNGVHCFQRGCERGAMIIIIKEVGMNMHRVNRIKLRYIH